jgi:hypothetical protein
MVAVSSMPVSRIAVKRTSIWESTYSGVFKVLVAHLVAGQSEHVDRGMRRTIAIIYMLLGVASVVGGAVGGKWWTLAIGVLWLLLGACWWWLVSFVHRRRQQSAASQS